MPNFHLSFDEAQTPTVWAENKADLYAGLGYIHARFRPLQTRLIGEAGRGRLTAALMPRPDLFHIDTLVHRMDIPAKAEKAAQKLDEETAHWVDAYVAGLTEGFRRHGEAMELKIIAAHVKAWDRQTVLGGLLISAYLGLAQGQERMERAIVEALQEGCEPAFLESLFGGHLDGWRPDSIRKVRRGSQPGFAAAGKPFLYNGSGGSNAWAITGERSASGAPMLCGDPHLQINQMPGLFFEVRMAMGDDYWLGASIPGLPGLAVGRNRNTAWSGTFGVSDNVDHFIIDPQDLSEDKTTYRHASVHRRFMDTLKVEFVDTRHGCVDIGAAHHASKTQYGKAEQAAAEKAPALATAWAGGEEVHEAMAGYMRLPFAESAEAAEKALATAYTMSLHFILADRFGDVRYVQAGRIPQRSWSGLFPVDPKEHAWTGRYFGDTMPHANAQDGILVSANEARLAPDGGTLSTLAQPPYRKTRIEALLKQSSKHDASSMAAIQMDVYSLQAKRLLPRFIAHLPSGRAMERLRHWDFRYDVDSQAASDFDRLYRLALTHLGPLFGDPKVGEGWFAHKLKTSELRTWWSHAIDGLLDSDGFWASPASASMRRALGTFVAPKEAWGKRQTFRQNHIVLGDLPGFLGFSQGPFPLPGSVATPCQGNMTYADGAEIVIGPAYRMICDLSEPGIRTNIPGGVHGSRFDKSFLRWNKQWLKGEYHQLKKPGEDRGDAERLAISF